MDLEDCGGAWCVPCLVQCIGTAIQGSFWGDSTGCDVMGFYSAFATYSSQMATLLIAYLTYRIVFSTVPKWEYVALVGLAIFVLSGLISMLPLIGVASYVKYDGFCYIDYRDVTHCVLWLLIMVPCVFGVLLLYVQIYKRSGLSKTVRFGLLGFWFVFLCGWVLGIPLIGFGLSNSEYPDNLNLVSGILGHLMNLINPLLYGIFWYKWFVADRQVAPQKELDTEFEVQDAYASSVPYALPAPWNTPVTPVQYPTYNGPPPVYTYDAPVAYPTYSGPLPTPAYTQVY
mmetsp:Transcript_10312/g.17559  ORF Transcript_10312/g.17559 Transcript_10312/m.17559 type:complete len:286 (-) Transcript_10312:1136-1993(-)